MDPSTRSMPVPGAGLTDPADSGRLPGTVSGPGRLALFVSEYRDGHNRWSLALPSATIQNAFNQLVSFALFCDGETSHKLVKV
jgi:hypothetical protein